MQHLVTPLSEATDVKMVKQGASLKEVCSESLTTAAPSGISTSLGYQHFGRPWETFVVRFVAEHNSPAVKSYRITSI